MVKKCFFMDLIINILNDFIDYISLFAVFSVFTSLWVEKFNGFASNFLTFVAKFNNTYFHN